MLGSSASGSPELSELSELAVTSGEKTDVESRKTLLQYVKTLVDYVADVAMSIFLILRQLALAGINAFFMLLPWKLYFVATKSAFGILFLTVGLVDVLNIIYETYQFFVVKRADKDAFEKRYYHHLAFFVVALLRSLLVLTACIGTVFFHHAFLLITSKLFFSAIVLGALYFGVASFLEYRKQKSAWQQKNPGEPFDVWTFCKTQNIFHHFVLCALLSPTVALVFAFPPGGLITAIFAISACVFLVVGAILIGDTRLKTSVKNLFNHSEGYSQVGQQHNTEDLGVKPELSTPPNSPRGVSSTASTAPPSPSSSSDFQGVGPPSPR
jgi:hypothetical protein